MPTLSELRHSTTTVIGTFGFVLARLIKAAVFLLIPYGVARAFWYASFDCGFDGGWKIQKDTNTYTFKVLDNPKPVTKESEE